MEGWTFTGAIIRATQRYLYQSRYSPYRPDWAGAHLNTCSSFKDLGCQHIRTYNIRDSPVENFDFKEKYKLQMTVLDSLSLNHSFTVHKCVLVWNSKLKCFCLTYGAQSTYLKFSRSAKDKVSISEISHLYFVLLCAQSLYYNYNKFYLLLLYFLSFLLLCLG